MMFTFLLILQTLVALAMVTLILMQRSEGGGLAGGGSPSGMMSARGAADFLTRSTGILAAAFVALSIVLAALAASQGGPRRYQAAPQQQAPVSRPAIVPGATPAPAAAPGTAPAAVPAAQPPARQQPAPANKQGGVPIAQ
jgi:preprotein translocase subunit SecG